MRLAVEDSYVRELRKLPPDRARAANESLVKFVAEPALGSLNFRPLRGAAGYFLINGRRGDRIVLRREAEDGYAAVDVGPHDNVLRRWNR